MSSKEVRIAFPEWDNPLIQEALRLSPDITPVNPTPDSPKSSKTPTPEPSIPESAPGPTNPNPANLLSACRLVATGQADSLIAGIDYTSRDVILACRDHLGVAGATFSSCFVLTRGSETYLLADAATCKHPTPAQLYDITLQTYQTALAVLPDSPRLAFLTFSTAGSGGHDPSISAAREVLTRLRSTHPALLADGEMQLDAAVVPAVAAKKFPDSPVAGRANVWILPDINSANILYKALERFAGFTAAGPILQGFNYPCSDLSRGSTVADILAVIEVEKKLVLAHRKDPYPSIIPQIDKKVNSFSAPTPKKSTQTPQKPKTPQTSPTPTPTPKNLTNLTPKEPHV